MQEATYFEIKMITMVQQHKGNGVNKDSKKDITINLKKTDLQDSKEQGYLTQYWNTLR
jgi:hypothetical protein